jgi:heptosyltransferase-2
MMSQSDFRKILVIQTASIGDVILATPVLEKLHFHFPEARIDFFLTKGKESLFTDHPFLHSIVTWDKKEHKYKNLYNILKALRNNGYDLVVNIQRFASSGFITAFSGARLTIGFNKNPFSFLFSKRVKHKITRGEFHEIERNQSLLDSISDNSRFKVRLYPSQSDYARLSQYKTRAYITVSPASLWFTKQYPAKKWAAFLGSLDPTLLVYHLGSKKDHKICDQIIEMSGHKNSLNLAGKLSFLESAALMRDAQMNFMNDSAPLHLASSVNAKTTAIFCSTVKEFGFGPLSDDSVIVETRDKLDCRPCGLHGHQKCPEKHFKCALTINEDDLLKRINQ